MIGEKIYEYVCDMTENIDFGVGLEALLSGQVKPPLHGARFDAHFEGTVEGRISGRISGCDFAFMRPDGNIELNIHARIDLGGGKLIALAAGGVGLWRSGEPVLDLSENVRLTTAHADFDWVNGRQIWATGNADLGAGKIVLAGYMQ